MLNRQYLSTMYENNSAKHDMNKLVGRGTKKKSPTKRVFSMSVYRSARNQSLPRQ